MTAPTPARIHLDTDIGGDTDDLCALAMVLGGEADLAGVTTVADRGGRRAAFVHHALRLAGRDDIPVASGAFGFLRGFAHEPGIQDERYWPGLEDADATGPGSAFELLCSNAAAGATIVAIGPYTNIAMVEALRPGALDNASLVVMGGLTRPPAAGLPQWGSEWDYNVQADSAAARIVFERLAPLIVPVEISVQTWLRRTELDRLRGGGPLARLIASQAELYCADNKVSRLAAANPGLPPDLLNFQHDPLAVAVAMGWDCVTIEEVSLAVTAGADDILKLERDPAGKRFRLVTEVDSKGFSDRWMETILRAGR